MDNPFQNMSDADIARWIRANSGDPVNEPAPAEKPFRVQVGDSVIEAATADELNKAVQAKLEDALRASRTPEPAPPVNPGAPPAPPKWDMKSFVDTFSTDPDEGLDYLERAKYGISIRKTVPQMLPILGALVQKVQELEAAQFAPREDSERKAVEQILRERQWAPSRQSYQDALDIAKGRGILKPAEEKPVEQPRNERGQFASPQGATNGTVFIPPRTPRTTTDTGSFSQEELLNAAQTMPLDKLKELLKANGFPV